MNLENNGDIVDFLDFFCHNFTVQQEPRRHFCFVMELLGHSVFKLLMRYSPKINPLKSIPIPVVKQITKSMLSAIMNLHKCGYMHTDVKPENLALQYFLPEISDSLEYSAPELIFG